MRKINFFLLLIVGLLGFSTVTAQQDSSGIYKTANDYKQKKLSYAINYRTEKHKINDNLLFNTGEIKVNHHGENYTLQKSETYGFRNMKGEDFRFVGNDEYSILNPGESVLMYKYQHLAHSPKEAEKYLPKYFFSKDASSVPQPLTKDNLKAAFPQNHKLHDALDAQFKTDHEIYAYDQFHKMYKLNWLMINNMQ